MLYSKYYIKIKATTYLKPSHVPGIAGVFQTVLIAFQEKLQEKSEKQNASFQISCAKVMNKKKKHISVIVLSLSGGSNKKQHYCAW